MQQMKVWTTCGELWMQGSPTTMLVGCCSHCFTVPYVQDERGRERGRKEGRGLQPERTTISFISIYSLYVCVGIVFQGSHQDRGVSSKMHSG